MKALSVHQPWAWAIAYAGKNIENRSWHMRHRGALAIHAGISMTRLEYYEFLYFVRRFSSTLPTVPRFETLARGAIIAICDAADCIHQSNSRWYEGDHGLLLREIRVLQQPVPCKGALKFFDVPEEIESQIKMQL